MKHVSLMVVPQVLKRPAKASINIEKRRHSLCFYLFIICVVLCQPMTARCRADQRPSDDSATEISIKAFLCEYLKDSPFGKDKTTKISFSKATLSNNATHEIILYLTGRSWCGTGGCSAWILVPRASSYEVISKIQIVNLPIRVLAREANGWHDIGVWVQGGGVQPGYEAVLSFDGKSYPANPSMPPARHLGEKNEGTTIIPSMTEGILLYGEEGPG